MKFTGPDNVPWQGMHIGTIPCSILPGHEHGHFSIIKRTPVGP